MVVDLDDDRPLSAEEIAAVCDRRAGVGADGVIRIVRTDHEGASFFMDYANADGSVAEMCGNGIRCVGVLLHDRGLTDVTSVDVLTRAGVRHLTLHADGGCAAGDHDDGHAELHTRVDARPGLGDLPGATARDR